MRLHQYTLLAVLLTLGLVASMPAVAETQVPSTYTPTIHSIDRERAPFIQNRHVVFTYEPSASARFVALRFEHENYAVIHPYSVNVKNVFVLVYEPPQGTERLVYRVSVDGLWKHDRANPSSITDLAGRRYSVVDLREIGEPPLRNPTLRDGSVRLTFTGQPGMSVSVCGSFNGWDPFADSLPEISPGRYTIDLTLAGGEYHYYFFVNGERTVDPYNPEYRRSPDDYIVSYFALGVRSP